MSVGGTKREIKCRVGTRPRQRRRYKGVWKDVLHFSGWSNCACRARAKLSQTSGRELRDGISIASRQFKRARSRVIFTWCVERSTRWKSFRVSPRVHSFISTFRRLLDAGERIFKGAAANSRSMLLRPGDRSLTIQRNNWLVDLSWLKSLQSGLIDNRLKFKID